MVMKGKIRWFDAESGKGIVRCEDGKSYEFHFTAIDGVSKNNHQWMTEEDKKKYADIKDESVEFSVEDQYNCVDYLKLS